MMDWKELQKYSASFCAWREVRGETKTLRDSIRGVIHAIDNRGKLRDKSWIQIVYQYLQFSSMTAPGDPQIKAGLVPVFPDQIFELCYEVADQVLSGIDPDLTEGATNYFNPSVVLPDWAAGMTKTVSIGHHDFYK